MGTEGVTLIRHQTVDLDLVKDFANNTNMTFLYKIDIGGF